MPYKPYKRQSLKQSHTASASREPERRRLSCQRPYLRYTLRRFRRLRRQPFRARLFATKRCFLQALFLPNCKILRLRRMFRFFLVSL